MKKTLLILLVCFGLSLAAQNKQAGIRNTTQLKKSIVIEKNEPNGGSFSGTKSLDLLPIASTLNGYTLASGKKVSADQTSKTVLYVSRGGPSTGTYVANDVHMYLSADNGSSWDTIVLTNNDNHRYPGGNLFRISGDNNLYVVSTGPAITGSDFTRNFFFSSKADGTLANDTSILMPVGSALFHVNEAQTVLPSGELFVFGEKNGIAPDYLHIDYSIFKFQWDNINKKFHFVSTKEITHLTSSTQPPVQPSGLAFSSDGTVGYMWFNGMDSITRPNLSTQPIVYKTIDTGRTWNMMPLYDYSQIQLLKDSIWALRTNPDKIRPVFSYGYTTSDKNMPGIVDASGNLHLLVNIQGGYSENPDSLQYTFVYETTKLFDLYTTSTGWDAKYVDSLRSGVDDGTTGTFGDFALDHRISLGKTADGNIIFAMWTDTDPSYGEMNILPNFFSRAFNLTTGLSTRSKNFTVGTSSEGIINYMNASDIIFSNAGVYNIPVVVIEGATPEDVITHKFAAGLEFTDAEFDPFYGIKENSNNFNVSQNYPNPFNGTTAIDVKLQKNANVSIIVSDLLGRVITNNNLGNVNAGTLHYTLSSDNLNQGIYFYTVVVGNEKTTRKMSVK